MYFQFKINIFKMQLLKNDTAKFIAFNCFWSHFISSFMKSCPLWCVILIKIHFQKIFGLVGHRGHVSCHPAPVHKSTQMVSGSGQYFSHSYDRGSGRLPAGISVSQDSSQRSLRVNCQSQTFLHCSGSFDRVQCLMPGSGVMIAGWKPFDHKRHCVREPGVTSRQIKFDDFLTIELSFLILLIHDRPRLGWLGIGVEVESLTL